MGKQKIIATEYVLNPLGRKIMIAGLILLFVLFFASATIWLIPFNFIIGLFSSFQLVATIFIRGAGAVLFSIVVTAWLLDRVYARIGWYRFSHEDKFMTLYYKNSILEKYQQIDFPFRTTMIRNLDHLMWIVGFTDERRLSILMRPPEEVDGQQFYESFDELVDDNYFKVKKSLEQLDYAEFPAHYMFMQGKIKKFTPREFELITGLKQFYDDENKKKKKPKKEQTEEETTEDVEDNEETKITQGTDAVEVEYIIKHAINVASLE